MTDAEGRFTWRQLVRSNTRFTFLGANTTVDAVYPTGASADVDVAAVRGTAATVAVSASKAPYRSAVTVTGRLQWKDTAEPLAGQPVELWTSRAGGPWTRVGAGKTTAAGVATWKVTPAASSRYQVRHTGGAVATSHMTGPATSATASVTVVAKVGVSGPTTVKAGRAVTVTGTAAPVAAGQQIQVQVNGMTVATPKVTATGTFRVSVKFAKGKAALRAKVGSRPLSAASTSSTVKVTAK